VTITAAAAAAFRAHGYQFVVRYVRRDKVHKHDLTDDEAARILDAGLGLMAVQHVESEDAWTPSAQKGTDNGGTAAEAATKAGLPSGVTLWCDLEGVESGTDAQEVVEYCNNWHSAVPQTLACTRPGGALSICHSRSTCSRVVLPTGTGWPAYPLYHGSRVQVTPSGWTWRRRSCNE
jgi:hypothetical protein